MTRIFNAHVLVGDGTFRDADIVFDRTGRITHVGDAPEPQGGFDEQIDAHGALVLPGFKNAHTHSAMTFLRSRADDQPLSSWLHDTVFPREALLTDEDVYWLTRLAVLEYVRGGTTAAFDMYFHTDAYATACIESGFRTVLCASATAFEEQPIAKVRDLYETHNRAGSSPLTSACLGFHAEYTASDAMLSELAELARALRAPVFAHNSETAREVEECRARHGKSPTEYMDSLGLFEFGGGGFHCVYLSERDVEIFRERGLYLVSCPASNLKLASGIAPLAAYAEAKIPIALGTDGPASNNALNMFREMYLACTLQKALTLDAAAMRAEDVLTAACSTGARAMGLSDCDAIAPGKMADLVFLSTEGANLHPLADPTKSVVYSADVHNVCRTMVAGRTLYENGSFFVGEDPERIYREAARITERIEHAL